MSSLLSPPPPLSTSSSSSLSSLLSSSSSSSSMSGRGTALTAASIANADVSARGRSRWWDRPPSRYSPHFGAAINRRTSHKSRLLGARTTHQSQGTAPMISVSNADVSARGRSRWWDRAPCRYSRHLGAD